MEGALTIQPGDWVSGGYHIKVPGNHAADTVALADAELLLPVSCTDNGALAGLIHVPLSAGPYDVPQSNDDWFPASSSTADPAVFQGAIQAPNLCSGGPMYNQTSDRTFGSGATLTADLQATSPHTVNVQFHYRDPNAKGKGNVSCADPSQNTGAADVCGATWSATAGLEPDVTSTPVPVGTIGALGLAGTAGLGLVVLQHRRRRPAVNST
jgi:hypothetical protein